MNKTLSAKMTIIITAVFFVLTPLCGFFIVSTVHRTMKESIARQQDQSVGIIAQSLDDKLAMIQDVITSVAVSVPPNIFDNPGDALNFIKSRYTLKAIFDNGLFMFDKKGRIVAELPVSPPRVGADFSFRESIQQTLKTQKSFISDAYVSTQKHHHPAVMFTAPVFSKDGSLNQIKFMPCVA